MIRDARDIFDVVIIGTGYTGLTAARDLTTAGLRVLLVEGRDRLGGRAWTSAIDGYQFELGGTWVHWFQPHVYRELSRYEMENELLFSPDYTKEKNYFTFVTEHGSRQMSHEEEMKLFSRAIEKFVNVDGLLGKGVMPFPFNQYWNTDVLQYANMSIADRLDQIKNDLSDDERNAITAITLVCSGGTRENSAFLDFLRWWAASGHDYKNFMETVIVLKLKCGQSAFALRFFREALGSGKLSYTFNTTVSFIDSSLPDAVHIHARNGREFLAKRVICTVPLNVLHKVEFNPPLPPEKRDAINHKHVNQIVKLHAEINDPGMRSWSGATYPDNKLLFGAADGTTPAGTTHCVFFGCHENHLHAEEDIDGALKALEKFAPMDVQRLVSHNWSSDEFAEGAWAWYQPGAEVKYLDALRKRHGPVLFSNSDWAGGAWRSFIDGAIQSGTEAAMTVKNELQTVRKASHL
ncbi:hypothetical protein CLAIMM_06676 [Cladophialophora immunda]|nr:hypothetical protein CLAIMM_06676 [Cladophialophora immunda]